VERGGVVLGRTADRVIECAFMASPPAHRLWLKVFDAMQDPSFMARFLHGLPRAVGVAGFDAAHVLFHTGPQMMRCAVRRYQAEVDGQGGEGITVLDSRYLSQRSWWRRYESRPSRGGFVWHHYANSWLEADEARFVRRFTARAVVIGSSALVLGFAIVGVLVV
jgi:hypothetical protein